MLTIEEIREKAQVILRRFRVTLPPVPVDKIARDLGTTLRYSPFEGNLAGGVFRRGKEVIIGVNSVHHVTRQRFTIAHEIGHFLLHKGKEVHIDRDLKAHVNWRNPEAQRVVDPEEVEANRFAAELLMPYDMLIKDVGSIDADDENDLRELANKYVVSLQAMTIRISAAFLEKLV
jgi:Zn-dependent peptidase ImmA (M78 family)